MEKIKFRELKTTSGKEVLAGKDKESNEKLVKLFKGKSNKILHTEKPGSPFCVVNDLKPIKKDIEETAVMCAKYSQDWRDNKSDVSIHVFTGKDVYKRFLMPKGTFGVRNAKKIKVKKQEIIKFERKMKKK